jgi:hypothetical protein
MATPTGTRPTRGANHRIESRYLSAETRAALRTPELIVYLASVLGVLIASAVVGKGDDGNGFGADHAWLYVSLLTIGYLVSRGLAKSGTRHRGD